jgi:hypothetical protein
LPNHPITESSLPSPEEVREQLQTILGSRSFVTAVRARRFLTHIVEQTLAGRTEAIKELVLGIKVFDRRADFDPKTVPPKYLNQSVIIEVDRPLFAPYFGESCSSYSAPSFRC